MNRQKIVSPLMKLDRIMSKTVEVFCVILLVVIVITVSVSVFTRFVIFYPLSFADALAKYMMIWMALLGSGLAFKAGEHIAVDMFIDKLQGSTRKVLLITIDILISVFLIIIIYYGFIYAWSGKGSHDPFVFDISMMIPYLSIPISFSYILFQLNITTLLTILRIDGQSITEDKNTLLPHE